MHEIKLKEQLFNEAKNFVNERYTVVQDIINSIQHSLQSETKSSAGDKHETGRAMLQLEREKAGNQFLEIERLQHILKRIDITKSTSKVSLGSLVTTNKGIYFIAIGRGLVKLNNHDYYVIALHSPIGKLLFGKEKGATFSFNKQNFEILEVG